MADEQAAAIAALMTGMQLTMLHIFNCLHHRGVLPLAEAARSLAETEANIPADADPRGRVPVQQMVKALRDLAAKASPPDPSAPQPPTRPNLRLIRGGRSD